ncbi:carbon-nitrogen hydrolase [Paxillus ammoniavirescens]|nr:carbon-nitrogen hydrolase [Paxillus ammoniavirescens]
MAASSSKLRIAVVQFAPKLGQVQANIAKARELCAGLTPKSIDLLCFPEMIFSGYMFPDAPSIAPYLEHPKTGPTSTFCAELARHLQCYVAAGYPERLALQDSDTSPSGTTNQGTTQPPLIGANSAVLYGPTGEHVSAYRKTNLFETDLTWAVPGAAFSMVHLPLPLGRTTIAICNDLNVQKPAVWESIEEGPYELARHCIRDGTRLLVLLNAWLCHKKDEPAQSDQGGDDPEDSDSEESDELGPNWEVLQYWTARLRPTWASDDGTRNLKDSEVKSVDKQEDSEDLLVVVCNRCGHEGEKTFVGSSAMLSMRRGSGRPRLLHAMGEREEGIGVWTTKIGRHTT